MFNKEQLTREEAIEKIRILDSQVNTYGLDYVLKHCFSFTSFDDYVYLRNKFDIRTRYDLFSKYKERLEYELSEVNGSLSMLNTNQENE